MSAGSLYAADAWEPVGGTFWCALSEESVRTYRLCSLLGDELCGNCTHLD